MKLIIMTKNQALAKSLELGSLCETDCEFV